MSQDHVPPQLTSEGEQLLADVLRRRSESSHGTARRSSHGRHDTASAHSNRMRRERDALRVPPEEPDETTVDSDESAGKNRLPMFSGLLVAAAIVAVAAFTALSPSPTVATEVAGVTEERSSEPSQTASTETAVVATTADEEPLVARSVPDVEGTTGESSASPSLVNINPGSIEVIVYDEDPAINGVHSFALRVKSISTDAEIDTNAFVVVVVDESGTESQTFSRFIHATLPVESSALATVRAEGAGPEQQFVVVRVGETEIARIPIGL